MVFVQHAITFCHLHIFVHTLSAYVRSQSRLRAMSLTLCTVLLPLGCTDTFTEYQNTNSDGGTFKGSGVSLQNCKDQCIADSTCVGIDYQRVKQDCWLHYKASDFDSTKSNSDLDQYRIMRCGSKY